MSKISILLTFAKLMAEQSQVKRARVGAVVRTKKGEIYGGCNQAKTHPHLAKLTDYPFLHAESAAILKVGLDNCAGATLVVTRINADNELTMAKPCPTCMKLISLAKIKTIYYTNWKGEVNVQQG